VVGDLAAALDALDGNVAGGQDVGRRGRAAQRDHRGVLAQKDHPRLAGPHPLAGGELIGEHAAKLGAPEPLPRRDGGRRLGRGH